MVVEKGWHFLCTSIIGFQVSGVLVFVMTHCVNLVQIKHLIIHNASDALEMASYKLACLLLREAN